MGMDRRKFLKIAGLTGVIGLGGKTAFDLIAPGEIDAALKHPPLTKGKKFCMVIDMSKMDDQVMDKSIEACHSIHNVPNLGNPKEEIKWIWKETYEHAFPGQGHEYIGDSYRDKNFPVLCNHCENPPCCRVCPTKATWKREDGVVMMDQHRCIGCRFCMAACPYGARSFNWGDPRQAPRDLNREFPTNLEFPTRTKGVVEKCNLCAERLAKGDFPACVEAAGEIREGSLMFGDLDDPGSEVRTILRSRFSIRRKPELGTGPNVYYII